MNSSKIFNKINEINKLKDVDFNLFPMPNMTDSFIDRDKTIEFERFVNLWKLQNMQNTNSYNVNNNQKIKRQDGTFLEYNGDTEFLWHYNADGSREIFVTPNDSMLQEKDLSFFSHEGQEIFRGLTRFPCGATIFGFRYGGEMLKYANGNLFQHNNQSEFEHIFLFKDGSVMIELIRNKGFKLIEKDGSVFEYKGHKKFYYIWRSLADDGKTILTEFDITENSERIELKTSL